MTDDTPHPDDTENYPDDHHHAIEACEHALDALDNRDLSHALTLLDEAIEVTERAQDDDTDQASRETAFDCYD